MKHITEGPCLYYDIIEPLGRHIEPVLSHRAADQVLGPMVVPLGVRGGKTQTPKGMDKTRGRLDFILKVWGPLKSLEEEHNLFKIVA